MSDEKKGLVPKLRFPEFEGTGEWSFVPLSKLAQRRTEKNRSGKLTRVLTNSAEHGVVDQRDFFDKDIAIQGNLESYCVVEKGDFVYNPRISKFAPVGPISKNMLATGVMSPLYTVFRFENENDDFYLHYFYSTGWHNYMRQVSSTGARHDRMAISTDDFNAIPLPVAPYAKEQQKIADCLSSLDALISAQADKVGALKTHKKALMQQLFPREGETVPRLRFPEFRDSGEWDLKPLEEILSIGSGKDYKHLSDGDIPVYGSGGYMRQVNDYLYEGESVCIGRKGTIDKPMFLNGKFWTVDTLFYTHSFKDALPKFVYALFQNIQWLKHNEAGGVPSLSKTNIEKIEVAIPKQNEQQKIADCLSSLDELIAAEADKLDALKTHKKGLMQQLFPVLDEAAV
ncbi:MAG: restriction endonuclease subunit S [Pseudomonadota bacterium]